ncbi:MAG: AMP-binding protein, partial [Sphingomonadaceae bacterium]|nr:AMP-binding protein [Sphingomonadaceae bacterium]
MHPSTHAQSQPDKPAIVMANSGEIVTFAELDKRSNKIAHLFRAHGLGHGDVIAICMGNRARFFDIVWGAQRAGLYYVAVSSRLTAPEIGYILEDSGAQMLFADDFLGETLDQIADFAMPMKRFIAGTTHPGYDNLEDAIAGLAETPVEDQRAGIDMLYSSGTTGRPKGVRLPLPEEPDPTAPNMLIMLIMQAFGLSGDDIYLSPAPLYHAAPLRWCMT